MDHEANAASKASAVGLNGQAQADANQSPMAQAHADVNEPPSKQAQAIANQQPPNKSEPDANQPHSIQLQAEANLLPFNQAQAYANLLPPNYAHANANHFPNSYNRQHQHTGTSRPHGFDNRTVICISIYADQRDTNPSIPHRSYGHGDSHGLSSPQHIYPTEYASQANTNAGLAASTQCRYCNGFSHVASQYPSTTDLARPRSDVGILPNPSNSHGEPPTQQ
jgi:hypothetical protein